MVKFNKNYFSIFLISITIALSYMFINPCQTKKVPLKEYYYKLKKENVSNNPAAYVKHHKKEVFYIHPGTNKPSIALLKIKFNTKLYFSFFLRYPPKDGDINFTVYKNSEKVKNFILFATNKKKVNFTLNVKRGDLIKIEADKYDNTDYDWGRFDIWQDKPIYKIENLIIIFLWVLFFIYLSNKGYKYFSLASYIIFLLYILAEKNNYGLLNLNSLLLYSLLMFAFSFLIIFIQQFLKKFINLKIIYIIETFLIFLMLLTPLVYFIYNLNFNIAMSNSALYDIFQTNIQEGFEYINAIIKTKYILLFIGIIIFIFFIIYKDFKKSKIDIEFSLLIFIITILGSIVFINVQNLRIPYKTTKALTRYIDEMKEWEKIRENRKVSISNIKANKKEKDETYIVIIGESLNRNHMGLYGYFRDTNPLLQKAIKDSGLLVFKDVYSNHIKTMFTLKLALTEANQYNKKSFNEAVSILEILKRSNVKTYWLTNQPTFGSMSNTITVLAQSADFYRYSTDRDGDEEYLAKEVEKILNKDINKTRVIFVHLYGNHTKYENRYPHDRFSKYKSKLNIGIYGKDASTNPVINSYDNSVLYNDYVVYKILKTLQKSKNSVKSLIYFSDHADDVIGFNGKMIGHHIDFFNFDIIRIPMIAWFSKGYKSRYNNKYIQLKKNLNKTFTNDMIYSMLIGIMNINTKNYNSKYDISSKDYNISKDIALTLHGKKKLTDKENYYYWQKKNARYINDNNLSKKVIVSNIDSLGKLNDALLSGYKSFQINIYYSNKDEKFYIKGLNYETNTTLDSYLNLIKDRDISRLVFGINVLNDKVINNLDILLKKYNIETNTVSLVTNEYSYKQENNNLKFKVFYKLKDKDFKNIDKLVKENISFAIDAKNYKFVKNYNTNLFVYNLPVKLRSTNLEEELSKNTIFKDIRVKIVALDFNTKFK